MIVVSGEIEVSPEGREAGVAAAIEMARATVEEAGCISYRFYADLERANVFRVFEEWETQEALDEHFQTEHMRVFRAKLGEIGLLSRRVKSYQVSAVADL